MQGRLRASKVAGVFGGTNCNLLGQLSSAVEHLTFGREVQSSVV
jgi:hypothetical protein